MPVNKDHSQTSIHPQEILPLQPLEQNKRVDALDILRGICLVGILLMNIEWFSRSMVSLGSHDTTLTGIDHAVGWLIRCFVEGKFYKLFALIFGMGFAVMLLRAKEHDRPFSAWFCRRMLVLLVIGIAHMIFIWGGDILHAYALAGFFLLFLVRKKKSQEPESYLKLAINWLMIPIFLISLVGIIFGTLLNHEKSQEMWQNELDIYAAVNQALSDETQVNTAPEITDQSVLETTDDSIDLAITEEEYRATIIADAIQDKRELQAEIAEEDKAFTEGSYWEATQYRISFAGFMLILSPFMSFFVLIPIFILGFWLVITQKITHHQQHKTFFRTLATIGLFAGLPLNIASILIIEHPAIEASIALLCVGQMLFYISQYILAAGYLGLIICALNKKKWQKLLSAFAPMGQMALTNYLMHSVILTSIFYGYAGGQYGEISRAPQILIVFSIIAGQLIVSKWWLSRYRFGPMEWLWRSLTYKKVQQMEL